MKISIWYSCDCGKWTASETFALSALDDWDRCDKCGSPLIRRIERQVFRELTRQGWVER